MRLEGGGRLPTERVQRGIDELLQQAETALSRQDWAALASAAAAVLTLDEANEDATTYLKVAWANGAIVPRPPATVLDSPTRAASPRVQQVVKALIARAEQALASEDWNTLASSAASVLALDESNVEALTYLQVASTNGAVLPQPSAAMPGSPTRSLSPVFEVKGMRLRRTLWLIGLIAAAVVAPLGITFLTLFSVAFVLQVIGAPAWLSDRDLSLRVTTAIWAATGSLIMLFSAPAVRMTRKWALGVLVPGLGLVGVARVCWRWATVLAVGRNPYVGR